MAYSILMHTSALAATLCQPKVQPLTVRVRRAGDFDLVQPARRPPGEGRPIRKRPGGIELGTRCLFAAFCAFLNFRCALQIWFAKVLRDGFAAAASGSFVRFKDIGMAIFEPCSAVL